MEDRTNEDSESKSGDAWRELIQQLQQALKGNTPHRLLGLLQSCIQILLKKEVNYNEPNFSEDLQIILDVCKHLDDLAYEKNYRENLANLILVPLVKTLKSNKVLEKILINYIKFNLPFNPYGDIKHSSLCSHQANSFDDFLIGNEKNPFQLLNKLRVDYISYLQKNPEIYEEAALVIRVLDYWRVFKSVSPNDFELSDIKPLLILGENLLVIALQTDQPLKSKELWRLMLLIQMLLCEHHDIKKIEISEWPRDGFVSSMIGFRYDYHRKYTGTATQVSPLLKDYKVALALTREIFKKGENTLQSQQWHTESIIQLLRNKIIAVTSLLGTPPCNLAVCVLGSTSRYDRRPYSDVELMILHSESDIEVDPHKKKKWESHVAVYIHHLVSLLELMIVRLGETHNAVEGGNAGFHLDSSCHVLIKNTWGTPEDVVKRFISEIKIEEFGQIHPWLHSETFFALLQPEPLHPGKLGSDLLIENYQKLLQLYLRAEIRPVDKVDIIVKLFEIKNINCFHHLTRRQGIAISCLRDVVARSFKKLDQLTTRQNVDIKQAYYKPLAFFALNLRIFFDFPMASPLEIMQRYTQSLSWGGEAILAWWQAALTTVADCQVKLHLEKGYQEEELSYALNTESEKQFWAGMDLIFQGFIKPLHDAIHKLFLGEISQIQEFAYVILQTYLNCRQSWIKQWSSRGIDSHLLLTHPLIKALKHYPDKSGWSPLMALTLQYHLESLSKLGQESQSACKLAGLPMFMAKDIFLSTTLVHSCFNNKGDFQGDPKYSSSTSLVRKITCEGRDWYLKIKPGNKECLMGREYAVMMLHLLLGGMPQLALGWPIKLVYANQGIVKSYYAWISEAVEEKSLGYVMINSPERLNKDKVDSLSYSQLFLLTFLCPTEDGQPENFKAKLTQVGKTQFVGIDYGQSFVRALTTIKKFIGSDIKVLNHKTMIFILEAIDLVFEPENITRIRLLNITEWFNQWKLAIRNINQLFKPLLDQDLQPMPENERVRFNRIVDLDDTVLECIKTRLELLQRWLRIQSAHEVITCSKILMALDPLVALQYQSLRPQIKTPDDFYTKIDVKAYVKDSKSGKMVSSSTFTSVQELTITPQQLQHSCDLDPIYFRHVDFKRLDNSQQLFTLTLLEATAEKKGKQFLKLDLSGCLCIEKNQFIRLLEYMPNLVELDISNCQQLSIMTLFDVFSYRKSVFFLSSNFIVLCPVLRCVRLTVNRNIEELIIRLELNARQRLTESLRGILNDVRRVRSSFTYLQNDREETVSGSAKNALAFLDQQYGVLPHTESDEYLSQQRRQGKSNAQNDISRQNVLSVLSSSGYLEPVNAIKKIRELGWWDDEIRDGLLSALNNKYDEIRSPIVELLGCRHWDLALREKLLTMLTYLKQPAWTYQSIIMIFARFGQWDVELRDALLGLFREGCAGIDSAIIVLGDLGSNDDVLLKIMLEKVQSEKYFLQIPYAQAIESLNRRDDYYRESLFKLLKNDSPFNRLSAAKGLVRLGLWNEEIWNVLMWKLSREEPRDYKLGVCIIKSNRWYDIQRDIQKWGHIVIDKQPIYELLIQAGRWDELICKGLLSFLSNYKHEVADGAIDLIKCLGRWDCGLPNGLINLLKVKSIHSRYAAFDLFAHFGRWDMELRLDLLSVLSDEDREIRESVVGVLGRLNHLDPEIFQILLSVLHDKDIEVRKSVLNVLGKYCRWDNKLRGVFLKALDDDEESIRSEAAEAIGNIGVWDDEIQSKLLNHMRDRWGWPQSAAKAFNRFGKWNDELRACLLNSLKNKDEYRRYSAVRSLGCFGQWDNEIRNGLLKALKHRSDECMIAIEVLVKLGRWDDGIRDGLVNVLKKGGVIKCTIAAAQAIGKIGKWDEVVCEGLLPRLKDGITEIRTSGETSFRKLCIWNEHVRDGLIRLLEDEINSKYHHYCLFLARIIGDLGHMDDKLEKFIMDLLGSDNKVKSDAAETILIHLSRKSEVIAEKLLVLLTHTNHRIRLNSVKVLRHLHHIDNKIREGMFNKLYDKDSNVRCAAIDSLMISVSPMALFRILSQTIQNLNVIMPSPFYDTEMDKIIKRIFFFVHDRRTQQAIPCVSQKWRSLYAEFLEDQRLQVVPELGNELVSTPDSKNQGGTTEDSSISENTFFGMKY